MQAPFFVLLDDAVTQKGILYEHLVHIDTLMADELGTLQNVLETHWQKSWHAVVWAPYDLGRQMMNLSPEYEIAAQAEAKLGLNNAVAPVLRYATNTNTAQPLDHVFNHITAHGSTYATDTTTAKQATGNARKNQLCIYWFQHKVTLDNEAAIQTWLFKHEQHETPSGLANITLAQDKQSYLETIAHIREDIAAGEIYQINYTSQLNFQAYGSPYKLYQKIRANQRVPYGALACLPSSVRKPHPQENVRKEKKEYDHDNGYHQHEAHHENHVYDECHAHHKPHVKRLAEDSLSSTEPPHPAPHIWTLCFSPELFLDIRKDGTIHTEPMKGTVATADDGLNEQRAHALRNDAKNRAENVMIVDLLRNDLSKIAIPNGVQVKELFKVTNFGSVLQMTTPIQAQVIPSTQAGDIVKALFPCGSITGAPKKRSMQLIDQYEAYPRGLYTGSMGFLEPCQGGLGFYGKLNVVIRTLELSELVTNRETSQTRHQSTASDNKGESKPVSEKSVRQCTKLNTELSTAPALAQFIGHMGVGSGIVYDSIGEQEYEECHWKTRFLRNLPMDFTLFETMRYENGQCLLLEQHISRLQRSAFDLGLTFNEKKVRETVQVHLAQLAPQITTTNAQRNQTYRIKAILKSDGSVSLQSTLLDPLINQEQTLILANVRLSNHDILRRYKTTYRQNYDAQMQFAIQQGAFDSLCLNQDKYLLEGARSSIFIFHQNQWHTPHLDLDILHSVMRAQILQKPEQWLRSYTPARAQNSDSSLSILESRITLEQLRQADVILAVNALRGIVPGRLVTHD